MYRHFYLHKYLLFYNVAVIEERVCVLGMGGGGVNLRFTPVASHLYKQLAARSHLNNQKKNVVGLFSVFFHSWLVQD